MGTQSKGDFAHLDRIFFLKFVKIQVVSSLLMKMHILIMNIFSVLKFKTISAYMK